MAPSERSTSAVDGLLLAAGAGRRAGGPKALRTSPDGRRWVRHGVEVLLQGGCRHVQVVVGASGEEVAALLTDPGWGPHDRVTATPSSQWSDGLSASLRAGLGAANADAVVVHLVDLPDVGPEVITRLTRLATRAALARATYARRPGHPVLLGADHWPAMLPTLVGDRGAQAYLVAHDVVAVECGDLASGLDDDDPKAAGCG
jgi:CTP:molybdopterin cytidylyltransferase MocA